MVAARSCREFCTRCISLRVRERREKRGQMRGYAWEWLKQGWGKKATNMRARGTLPRGARSNRNLRMPVRRGPGRALSRCRCLVGKASSHGFACRCYSSGVGLASPPRYACPHAHIGRLVCESESAKWSCEKKSAQATLPAPQSVTTGNVSHSRSCVLRVL